MRGLTYLVSTKGAPKRTLGWFMIHVNTSTHTYSLLDNTAIDTLTAALPIGTVVESENTEYFSTTTKRL